MHFFLRLLIAACLVLLNWWHLETTADSRRIVTILVLGLSGLAILLVCKRRRAGLWLAMLVGLGHLIGILLTIPPEIMPAVLPFVAWCVLVIVCSALLLALTRERRKKRTVYERYPEF